MAEDQYEAWAERYAEAGVALDNRDEKVAQVCEEIEKDLRLLGATAIEDRLQDGVPETIADLKLAGIKVWVATGDKLETAIAIGYSTNLISHESNLIVIRGGDKDALSIFDQMYTAITEFFPDSNILEEEQFDIKEKHRRRSTSSNTATALHRVNTGVSSIVGHNNGERPGGFVLVIEGTALEYVSIKIVKDDLSYLLYPGVHGRGEQASTPPLGNALRGSHMLPSIPSSKGTHCQARQGWYRCHDSCNRRWCQRCQHDSGCRRRCRYFRRGGFASRELVRLRYRTIPFP